MIRIGRSPPLIQRLLLLFLLFPLIRIAQAATASFDLEKTIFTSCSPSCFSGACIDNTCVCSKGWKGPQCDLCHGRVEVKDLSNPIIDSPVNYPSVANCGWLVDVANSTSLKLRLSNFSTECGWDYLYVYDGEGTDGEQLAALCGSIEEPFEINLPSTKAFVFFFSDLAQNHDGFNISVEQNSCPYNCSGAGKCEKSGECTCNTGHTGKYCEQWVCTADQTDKGPCIGGVCEDGKCSCSKQYHGDLCQEDRRSSLWETVLIKDGPIPRGRASHTSVFIPDRQEIWTLFGDRFENVPNFNEIEVFDIKTSRWSTRKTFNMPMWRYDHSVVYYKTKLYVFGGVQNRSKTDSDLWSLDVNTLQWTLESHRDDDLITAPVAVYGHSAHVIDKKMFIFFGFNPIMKFSKRVQIFDFETKTWSFANITPPDLGRYKHSSVYYEPTKAVLVYGGIIEQSAMEPSSNVNVTTDKLLQFNATSESTYSWTNLPQSGTPMYMHTATIMNGLMITAGGNAYTKNGVPGDCFQGIVLSFDILCNKWSTMASQPILRRYGHSMVSDKENNAWVIGGFNGTMLNDIVKFTPADCSAAHLPEDCSLITEGVQCVQTDQKCQKWSPVESFPSDFLTMIKGGSPKAELKCLNEDAFHSASSQCEDNRDCLSCASHSGCGWCVAGNQCLPVDQECVSGQDMIRAYTSCITSLAPSDQYPSCSSASDCYSCKLMLHCNWFGYESKKSCVTLREQSQIASDMAAREAERLATAKVPVRLSTANFPTGLPYGQNFTGCPMACPEYTNCTSCVENKCMWCGSQKRCVYTDSYLISFPYGQCYQWTTNLGTDNNNYCEIESGQCSEHKNCSMCQLDPNCGWWDDGEGTGRGLCLEGNKQGPKQEPEDPSGKGGWYFINCPLCQCNGHSECSPKIEGGIETMRCTQCMNNTTGAHCETCADGFYGDTRNGGVCKECDCIGNSAGCHPSTGDCYCTTKGVIGRLCDRCDQKYIGSPELGRPCYYELTVDFIFTFKLKSEPPDNHVSEIYLFSVPYKRDTDVTFQISCDSANPTAAVSLNLTSNIFDGRSSNPKMKMINHPCDGKGLRRHYLANDPGYAFGTDANTTFFVKVSNFTTPITIQISFAQSPPINWVLFFVIFAACFIVLLVIAGLLWMVKLRVEAYRRRVNQVNEYVTVEEDMEGVSDESCFAEPTFFSTLAAIWHLIRGDRIDPAEYRVTPSEHPRDVPTTPLNEDEMAQILEQQEMASRPFCSVKMDLSNPSSLSAATPIAVEPRSNYRVGVVTVAMRLPTGGKPHTPNGTSGMALGSALCYLTPQQVAFLKSAEESDNRPKRKANLRRFFPFIGRGEESS